MDEFNPFNQILLNLFDVNFQVNIEVKMS